MPSLRVLFHLRDNLIGSVCHNVRQRPLGLNTFKCRLNIIGIILNGFGGNLPRSLQGVISVDCVTVFFGVRHQVFVKLVPSGVNSVYCQLIEFHFRVYGFFEYVNLLVLLVLECLQFLVKSVNLSIVGVISLIVSEILHQVVILFFQRNLLSGSCTVSRLSR